MPARRIVPCLDVRHGRLVKGVRFERHRDLGEVLAHARRYAGEGADELVFYDIAASVEGRGPDLALIEAIALDLDIPFAVAGGIRDRDQAAACLAAGADKVSINSPALERPALIEELARDFGRQCVVVGIDSLCRDGVYVVRQYTGAPRSARDAGRRTLDWVAEACARGCGEIVLNSMDHDGVRAGYDIAHCAEVAALADVPVIASGGAGSADHFRVVFQETAVSGALAASVFHDRVLAIPELKQELAACGIETRL